MGSITMAIDVPLFNIRIETTTKIGVDGIQARGSLVYFSGTGAGVRGELAINSVDKQTRTTYQLAKNPKGRSGDASTPDEDATGLSAEHLDSWYLLYSQSKAWWRSS